MLKFINKLELQDITLDLWNKTKQKYFQDVSFDRESRKLIFSKDGNESEVQLDFINKWEDLYGIVKYPLVNLYDANSVIDGSYYSSNGAIQDNDGWARFSIPVEKGEKITVCKALADNGVFTYMNINNEVVTTQTVSNVKVGSWNAVYSTTVPDDDRITQVGINITKARNEINNKKIMFYKGDVEPSKEYVPYTNGAGLLIDCSLVNLAFDSRHSDLTSATLSGAINEINTKINLFSNLKDLMNMITTRIEATSKHISRVDAECSKLQAPNVFTKKNMFENYSPIVSKNFVIESFGQGLSSTFNRVATDTEFVVDLSYQFNSLHDATHLLVPIKNAAGGEQIRASYFIVDSTSYDILEAESSLNIYTVQEDIEYMGEKCIKIPIARTFLDTNVSFGLRVEPLEDRGLHMVANSGDSASTWIGNSLGQAGDKIDTSNCKNISYSYQVVQYRTSEIVTYFDLELKNLGVNSTASVYTANNRRHEVGEVIYLLKDGKEHIVGDAIFKKCDGTTLLSMDYPEFAEFMNVSRKRITLPTIEQNKGVHAYVCVK